MEYADQSKFAEVIENLILYSNKFTENGTSNAS